MLNIILGVILVMLANILLGASLAKMKEQFNKDNLIKGLFKVVCVGLAVGFMYLCSYLNPNIMILKLNGIDVNLIEGIKIIAIAGIIYYGTQSITKLAKLINVSTDIKNESEDK